MSDYSQLSDTVLLVDDESLLLTSSRMMLESGGFTDVVTLEDARDVMPLLSKREVGLIVMDLAMPHISGSELLDQISQDFPQIPVIMMTASAQVEVAVECMQHGAYDYMVKPVSRDRLISAVHRALEYRTLQYEMISLKNRLLDTTVYNEEAFKNIITGSENMHSIFRYMEAISNSQQPILITGETGVGKELIAEAMHQLGNRGGRFVAENVAGLDDNMFTDTLFGHKRGAFTGADTERKGLATEAENGTLFLDEIGDLNLNCQIKLLRFLQDRSFYQLGSNKKINANARVIVATNCDVKQMVKDGTFRKDLYYRLQTHHIHIPALRERRDDIKPLVNHLVEKHARLMEKPTPKLPPQIYELLNSYDFPGNVRELEAMLIDSVARHSHGVLSLMSLKQAIGLAYEMTDNNHSSIGKIFPDRIPTLKEAESLLIEEALQRADGNQGCGSVVARHFTTGTEQATDSPAGRLTPATFVTLALNRTQISFYLINNLA